MEPVTSTGEPIGESGSARDRALIAAARMSVPDDWGSAPGGVEAAAADRFPGYQVLREIHRGGQGIVYQALQLATKRKVAIKVLHVGALASARDQARFEREVQILGQLDHPNVVSIHDSGQSDAGFFFVMDYIPGQPLDAFIRRTEPSIEEVVALFATICDAVNAAHLRGVIHRDLKPANIRVDPGGVPHVLDFGLAKAGADQLGGITSDEVMTMSGQFVGSLPWASPEQAEGRSERIDVRTDVYSLGVMLYQALTGRFPYDVSGPMRDVLENIARASPTRPSSLRRRINNEVETIVLKCLSKERDRRYQSAGELGRDLRRYLDGEPVEAKRDSGWYVIQKTLRRHVGAVAAGALVLVSMAGATVVSAQYARTAARERDSALEAKRQAEIQQGVSGTYASMIEDMLDGLDPDVAHGRDTSVIEDMLVRMREFAAVSTASQPAVAGAVHDMIGRSMLAMTGVASAEAEQHLRLGLEMRRRALGEGSPEVARSLLGLARVQSLRKDYAGAERLVREAWAIRRASYGEGSLEAAECRDELGYLLKEQDRLRDAEEHYRVALAVRRAAVAAVTDGTSDESRERLRLLSDSLNNLGQLAYRRRDYDQAAELLGEAVDLRVRALGEAHTRVATGRANLASVLRDRNRGDDLERAEGLLRSALAAQRRLFAGVPDHPHVAVTLNKLGLLLRARGDGGGAEAALRESLGMRLRMFGPSDRLVGVTGMNLGLVLLDLGRAEEARGVLRDAVGVLSLPGGSAIDLGRGLSALAIAELRLGEPAAAEATAMRSVEVRRSVEAQAPVELALAEVLLAQVRLERGAPAGTEALLRRAIGVLEQRQGAGSDQATAARSVLGECLALTGQGEAGEALMRAAYEQLAGARGPAHPRVREAGERLARHLERTGRVEEAARLRAGAGTTGAPAGT